MSQVSHISKLMQREARPIHFVRAKDSIGRDCYFFIMTSEQKMDRLEKQLSDSNLDLADFGSIVASGFGTEPSEAVSDMLKKHYHVDPTLIIRYSESVGEPQM
jgi:hypothetical protein